MRSTSLIDVGSHVGFVPFDSFLVVSERILKFPIGLFDGLEDREVLGIDFLRDDIIH